MALLQLAPTQLSVAGDNMLWSASDVRKMVSIRTWSGERLADPEIRAHIRAKRLWTVSACDRIYFTSSELKKLRATGTAARVGNKGGYHYWLYEGKVYRTRDSELSSDDIQALVNDANNKRRLQLQKAHALQAMSDRLDSRARRQPIPQDVKIAVWQRDGGRCVECGTNEHLEFDHIIPLAMGGANTMRNLQLLCAICNQRKGATLG
jgi:hypothetical protein